MPFQHGRHAPMRRRREPNYFPHSMTSTCSHVQPPVDLTTRRYSHLAVSPKDLPVACTHECRVAPRRASNQDPQLSGIREHNVVSRETRWQRRNPSLRDNTFQRQHRARETPANTSCFISSQLERTLHSAKYAAIVQVLRKRGAGSSRTFRVTRHGTLRHRSPYLQPKQFHVKRSRSAESIPPELNCFTRNNRHRRTDASQGPDFGWTTHCAISSHIVAEMHLATDIST